MEAKNNTTNTLPTLNSQQIVFRRLKDDIVKFKEVCKLIKEGQSSLPNTEASIGNEKMAVEKWI